MSLEALPTEMLDTIAEYCFVADQNEEDDDDPQTLLQLRLTSWHMEWETRNAWLRNYFNNRNVGLDCRKLKELWDIAGVPELAGSIQNLVVQCLDNELLLNEVARENMSEDILMELPEMYVQILAKIFRNLNAIKSIRFVPRELVDNDGAFVQPPSPLDFSMTLMAILKALEHCNLRPKAITAYRDESGDFDFGIADCDMLAQSENCFANVEEFEMCFLFEEELLNQSIDEMRVGIDLATGLTHLTSLRTLRLLFIPNDESQHIFATLAASVILPRLEVVYFRTLFCAYSTLSGFLATHSATLQSCALHHVQFMDMDESASDDEVVGRFSTFLGGLRQLPMLDWLIFEEPATPLGPFSFPGTPKVSSSEEENEDGYVEVTADRGTLQLEHGEIVTGIDEARSTFVWERNED